MCSRYMGCHVVFLGSVNVENSTVRDFGNAAQRAGVSAAELIARYELQHDSSTRER